MAILETQRLSKHFGNLAALDGVDFQVEEGEVFGIAGPNGAGKSTLFNVITGTYPPTSGKVFFMGREISGMPPYRICSLGIGRTFQVPQTFHSMSVLDNLRIGGIFGAGDESHVADLLDFLGLQEQAHLPASNLDLYTTKLTMVGAALATECKLLMLDEPMAGFSHVEIEQFLDLIRRINGEWGITIVIIEHLLDILIGISERMMILHYGERLFLGAPEDVREDPEVIEVYLGGKAVK
jgi:branched-chain amino acid transport system ATP-binding protein